MKYDDIYSSSRRRNINKIKVNKKKKIINTLVVIFSILCAVGGAIILYGNSLLSSLNANSFSNDIGNDSSLEQEGDATFTNNIIKDPMVLNIMLFGSDVRPDGSGNGRSDSMILLSIDNRHKKLKLTSFMRDSFVSIPGHGKAKLNSAYSFGGPELAINTIERNFGVDVDRYVVLYFDTFPKVIDALGGVDVELYKEEAAYLNNDFPKRKPKFSEAGTYHLNGDEALLYARIRYVGNSDFERTQRQRYLISQVVNKFKSSSDISTIVNVMKEFLPAVTTNITVNEMTSLAKNSLKYMNYPLSQFRLPTDDNYYSSRDDKWGAVLNIKDIKKAREELARFIYEETADAIYGSSTTSTASSSSSEAKSNNSTTKSNNNKK